MTNTNLSDISIAHYLEIVGENSGTRALRWQLASDHNERIEILHKALDDCYSKLIDARGINEKLKEDQLSVQIANMLSACSIAARHDQYVNGHVDIVVEANNGFLWLAEAKIHSGYTWLQDGFLQLSTRYGTSKLGRNHGELIIYHRGERSIVVLTNWYNRLFQKFPETELEYNLIDEQHCFGTIHVCSNSGSKFHTRHVIIPLHHNPGK